MTKVMDVMTRSVRTVSLNSSIREAAEFMREYDIGSLPVIQDKRLVGTITDRDITIRVTAEGRDPQSTLVRDAMTRDLVTVRPYQELTEAEALMHNHQVRRLPVVEQDGRVLGYLTLAAIARSGGDDLILGKLLKGICQPKKAGARKDPAVTFRAGRRA